MSLDRVLNMDIEWVLYHLVHNDASFKSLSLDVDFYDDDVWGRLLKSLEHNDKIKCVKVERYENGDEARSHEELLKFYTIISEIPSVKELTFSGIASQDFMATLPLLSKGNLCKCRFDWTTVDDPYMPLAVAEALANSESLIDLHLEDASVKNCGSWLAIICLSTTLKKLSIENYVGLRMDPGDWPVFEALRFNSTLQEISLGYLLDEDTLSHATEMLKHNSSLRTLHLSLMVSLPDRSFSGIIEALKKNNSIVEFENKTASSIDVPLHLQNSQAELLANNMRLTKCNIFREDDVDARNSKIMYLRLNEAGRGKLFSRAPQGEIFATDSTAWLNVMERTVDNLDCLFYCLSMNPTICMTSPKPSYKRKFGEVDYTLTSS